MLYAHDGLLAYAKPIAGAAGADRCVVIRVQHRQQEVSVIYSAPAPVDVEQTVAVVAVNDESMSQSGRLSAIDYRPAVVQFVIDEILPLTGTEI